MKKGYEIQKRSVDIIIINAFQVIENLDFYLTDKESNKELIPMIAVTYLSMFMCFSEFN